MGRRIGSLLNIDQRVIFQAENTEAYFTVIIIVASVGGLSFCRNLYRPRATGKASVRNKMLRITRYKRIDTVNFVL